MMSNDSLKGSGYFYLSITNSINRKQKLIKTTKRKAGLDFNMPVIQNQDRTRGRKQLKGLTCTWPLPNLKNTLFYKKLFSVF